MALRRTLAALLLASISSVASAADSPAFDWNLWRNIVVQDGGRMKPLDTHASEFVTGIAGRSKFRPAHFAPIAACDVVDWTTLTKDLVDAASSSKDGLAKRLATGLPPGLLDSLSKADFNVEALKKQVDKDSAVVDKLAHDHLQKTGETASLDELAAATTDPAALKAVEGFRAGRAKLDAIGLLQARLIRAINEQLQRRDLLSQPQEAPAEVQELAAKGTGALTGPELARLNRAAVQAALPGALKKFSPAATALGPSPFAEKKYDPVELYVTWLLTWQGWDKVKSFEDLGQGRDDKSYWKFHQPDVWDDLPLIDARFEGLTSRLQGEFPESTSIRSIAGNEDFDRWAIQCQQRARQGEELTTAESRAVEAMQSYMHFIQHRLGYSLHLGPKPTKKDADWTENHEWMPLIGLLVANGRVQDEGYDPALVAKVREGFFQARKGLLTGNAAEFNAGSKEFADALAAMGTKSTVYPPHELIAVETHYNRTQPFLWTLVLAIAASVALTVSLGVQSKTPYVAGFALLIASIGMMVYGNYLRVRISGRAPVTNMYETLIWAAFVGSVLAVSLGLIYRQRIIPTTAAVMLVLATLLAYIMPINMGASIDPLQPVLRKNYWLVVHVLTIVASYGAFMLAWALGNVGLGFYLFGRDKPESIKPMAMFVYRAMQVGFLLLAVGTGLGGWWAADSWGRFWGWDPKETWALIALLGYAVILHARYAGLIKLFGLMAGSVLAFSGVVMAWYGVNFVLGAGLHAYAFGTGGLHYVGAAVVANLLYVGLAYIAYRSHRRAAADGASVAPIEQSASAALEPAHQ